MGDVTVDLAIAVLIGIVGLLIVALTAILVNAAAQSRNERRFNNWLRRQDRGETRKPIPRGRWRYPPRINWSPSTDDDRRDDDRDDDRRDDVPYDYFM